MLLEQRHGGEGGGPCEKLTTRESGHGSILEMTEAGGRESSRTQEPDVSSTPSTHGTADASRGYSVAQCPDVDNKGLP